MQQIFKFKKNECEKLWTFGLYYIFLFGNALVTSAAERLNGLNSGGRRQTG